MANEGVRGEMKVKEVKQWEVAEAIGIGEFTLCRWLRHELTGNRLAQVRSAIEQIASEKGSSDACQHKEGMDDQSNR